MAREIWVQSQVESYQRLKKWYLMLSCLTLSIVRYVSRVKWSNRGKGVAPSPTPRCSSYRKGSLRVTLDYGRQLYFTLIYRYICYSYIIYIYIYNYTENSSWLVIVLWTWVPPWDRIIWINLKRIISLEWK